MALARLEAQISRGVEGVQMGGIGVTHSSLQCLTGRMPTILDLEDNKVHCILGF